MKIEKAVLKNTNFKLLNLANLTTKNQQRSVFTWSNLNFQQRQKQFKLSGVFSSLWNVSNYWFTSIPTMLIYINTVSDISQKKCFHFVTFIF